MINQSLSKNHCQVRHHLAEVKRREEREAQKKRRENMMLLMIAMEQRLSTTSVNYCRDLLENSKSMWMLTAPLWFLGTCEHFVINTYFSVLRHICVLLHSNQTKDSVLYRSPKQGDKVLAPVCSKVDWGYNHWIPSTEGRGKSGSWHLRDSIKAWEQVCQRAGLLSPPAPTPCTLPALIATLEIWSKKWHKL